MEVTNRFKGLDLIDGVPDELWTEVCDIVQETGIKTIPKKNKCKKAKWLSEEALQVAVKATFRTGHKTAYWIQVEKVVRQKCILSPCLFNLYAEYIMRNIGPDEAQAGIKIAGKNINNLRYADDTTLMAESEEELKSFLMKVKVESEKVGLKLNIQKTKIMASSPIASWQIDGETVETVDDYFWGLQNHCRW